MSSDDSAVLERAKAGDRSAFDALVAPYRQGLRAHAYRMLGSPMDADDVVQDALVRAWRSLGKFEGRSAFRTWLYRIVTNCAIDASRPARVLAADVEGPSAGDALLRQVDDDRWLLPFPAAAAAVAADARYDATQSVSLAFGAALQRLPPRQRAVLLLRDVLGFSAVETGEVLEDSVSAVNALLHRAREQVPEPKRAVPLDARARALLDRYVRAFVSADLPAMLAVIRDDAVLAMPPYFNWMRGKAAIAAFFADSEFGRRWRAGMTATEVAEADAPVLAVHAQDQPFALVVVHSTSDGLAAVDAFVMPRLVAWWETYDRASRPTLP